MSKYTEFQSVVKDYYLTQGRVLPWRLLSDNPRQRFYEVLISEVMLQQTQVRRVVSKYSEWMTALPNLEVASTADFQELLALWQGLGYNRRARYLYDCIALLSSMPKLPDGIDSLTGLPGIGVNTAGAILAYCYNKPVAFVETNIRTVYMFHFPDLAVEHTVSDKDILQRVSETIDTDNPREWFWALMDYGTYLKSQGVTNRASKHYVRQSKFEGSLRQLRARIVRELLQGPRSINHLEKQFDDPRTRDAVQTLVKERTIVVSGDLVSIQSSK